MTAVATPPAPANPLQGLVDKIESFGTQLTELQNRVQVAERTPAYPHDGKSAVLGAPNVRRGEDTMSSRGFMFAKLIGVRNNIIPPEQAQLELNACKKLQDAMQQFGWKSANQGNYVGPLGFDYLPQQFSDSAEGREIRELVIMGAKSYDPEEAARIAMRAYSAPGQKAAQSWIKETLMGSVVPPPDFGELIPLLRNKEALVAAGVRVIPLPPQGRLIYPRQTGAATAYWLGENTQIPSSNVTTGSVILSAKKLAVLIKVPNELIRFASPAAEAILRDDMTKDLALGLDLAGLEGQGTSNTPLGIIKTPGISTISSSSPDTNGDYLNPKDPYRMIAQLLEKNAEMEAFVMRPQTLLDWYQIRADSVTSGDRAGLFVYNLIREAGDRTPPMLAGYPVVTSTQVSRRRVKAAGTQNTYILAGMFSDAIMAMFGTLEFASTGQSDEAFQYDQTHVRGILTADFAVRHQVSFCLMDQLVMSNPS